MLFHVYMNTCMNCMNLNSCKPYNTNFLFLYKSALQEPGVLNIHVPNFVHLATMAVFAMINSDVVSVHLVLWANSARKVNKTAKSHLNLV